MNPALHTKEEIMIQIECLEFQLHPPSGDGEDTSIGKDQQEQIEKEIEDLKKWL